MKLNHPLIITPRLLPGVQIGKTFISIEFDGARNGRVLCRYYIDIPEFQEYSANDISGHKSGKGGADLQSMLESLLDFLSAAGESYAYQMRDPDFPAQLGNPDNNSSLFPPFISEWAYQYADELALMAEELKDTQGLIEEGEEE